MLTEKELDALYDFVEKAVDSTEFWYIDGEVYGGNTIDFRVEHYGKTNPVYVLIFDVTCEPSDDEFGVRFFCSEFDLEEIADREGITVDEVELTDSDVERENDSRKELEKTLNRLWRTKECRYGGFDAWRKRVNEG